MNIANKRSVGHSCATQPLICDQFASGEFHIDITAKGFLVGHPCCLGWLQEDSASTNALRLTDAAVMCDRGLAWDVVEGLYATARSNYKNGDFCRNPKPCPTGEHLAGDSGQIRRLVLSTSLACNLACSMCRSCYIGFDSDALSVTKALMYSVKGKHLDSVTPTMLGEPFMLPFLREWLGSLTAEDTKAVVIYTNGTLLRVEELEPLTVAMKSNGVHFRLWLSIDGTTKETYSAIRGAGADFEHVMLVAKEASRLGILEGINYVLQPDNELEFSSVKAFFAKEGLPEPSILVFHRDYLPAIEYIKHISTNHLEELLNYAKVYDVNKQDIVKELEYRNEASSNSNLTKSGS